MAVEGRQHLSFREGDGTGCCSRVLPRFFPFRSRLPYGVHHRGSPYCVRLGLSTVSQQVSFCCKTSTSNRRRLPSYQRRFFSNCRWLPSNRRWLPFTIVCLYNASFFYQLTTLTVAVGGVRTQPDTHKTYDGLTGSHHTSVLVSTSWLAMSCLTFRFLCEGQTLTQK